MGLLLQAANILLALGSLGTAQLRVDTSPAPGLGPERGVGRLDPSDVFRFGDQHAVLYTRVTSKSQLYPAPLEGEIWWALSEDGGSTWEEQARVLGPNAGKDPDARGVFDPQFQTTRGGRSYLVYAGIGPGFNVRFERQGRSEPTALLLAELTLDPGLKSIRAQRLKSILFPSPAKDGAFDSLRVRSPVTLSRDGQTYLYYQGLAFHDETAKSPTGLVLADSLQNEFTRRHEGRPVLPFDGDALFGQHAGGTFALLTRSDRGLWWSADGEHFAPIDLSIRGRLASPGLFRNGDAEDLAPGTIHWGLHVARTAPDPYLERFELRVSGELTPPIAATIPTPSLHRSSGWAEAATWKEQHVRSSAAAVQVRPRYVFLGAGIVESFGGHKRSSSSVGQAPWEALFLNRSVANLGIEGDLTSNLLWRLDHGAIPDSTPRAILLLVGRKQLEVQSPQEVAAGVETILRRLRASRPSAEVILTSLPLDSSLGEAHLKASAEFNRLLAKLGRRPNVIFLDLAGVMQQSGTKAYGAAGEALTVAGYEQWANALDPILDELETLVPEGADARLRKSQR